MQRTWVRTALALTALVLGASSGLAQSNPGLSYGQIPTAGQWNSYFTSKQDALGFVPLNVAGGTMLGPLFLTASTASASGMNLAPGVAPTTPNNGDVWVTPSGFYVQAAGLTYNLAGGPITCAQVPTLTGSVTTPGGSCVTTLAAGAAAANLGSPSGDLTGSYPSPSISANAVTNAKLATMPSLTVKGNITGGTANAVDSSLSAVIDASAGSTRGSVLERGASGWTIVAPGTSGYILTSNGPAADPTYQVTSAVLNYAIVNQTVTGGPATNGLPTFLPATSASLTLTTTGVSASVPLTATAAQGYSAQGVVSSTYYTTANISWTATASTTSYLYVNAATGATGVTTLVPIYQYGGAPSTVNNQFTFDYSTMIGYMGNGSTAPATPLVFFGEAVAAAGSITSTIAYAYNGKYDSGWTATLQAASSIVSKNHNLGITADAIRESEYIIQNTTTEASYSVGDTVMHLATNNGTYALPVSPIITRATMAVATSSGGFTTVNKSTGVPAILTAADWKYKFIIQRGW